MPTDKDSLIQALEQHKEEIIKTNAVRLQYMSDSHYEMIDYERHLEREEMFLDAFLRGLREDIPDSFVKFVEDLTLQRLNEGYSLEEFQRAFHVVENTLWEMLVADFPCDTMLIEILAIVRDMFDAAQDHLAQVYLHKALSAERELDEVRRKFRVYRKTAAKLHI